MSWLVRMKPKLKNYRWWLALPIVMIYALIVIAPFMLIEFLFEQLYSLSQKINTADSRLPEWLESLLSWSDSNDKIESR